LSNRRLVPFARRDDSDDIVCFEVGQDERVFIIHDFAMAFLIYATCLGM